MGWLKKVFSPKNIGTVGGFLLGGPIGAGVGRTLGGAVSGDKILSTKTLKNFGVGLGAGYVGSALPGVGGMAGKYGTNLTVGRMLGRGGSTSGGGKPTTGTSGGGWSVGSGLTGMDKASLLLGGLGAAGSAAGAYYEGQGADEDRALAAKQWESEFGRQTGLDTENTRRYDQDYGESARRYGLDFGENQRQFDVTSGENTRQFDVTTGEGVRRFDLTRGDERSDVEYERDLMRRKGQSVSPYVGRLLKLGRA